MSAPLHTRYITRASRFKKLKTLSACPDIDNLEGEPNVIYALLIALLKAKVRITSI